MKVLSNLDLGKFRLISSSLIITLVVLLGSFQESKAESLFPSWTDKWRAACLKNSFGPECFAALSNNRISIFVNGTSSGSKNMLNVDIKSPPSSKNKTSYVFNCTKTTCTGTLLVKNISKKPWKWRIRFHMISNADSFQPRGAIGYPNIDFSDSPLAAGSSVYIPMSVDVSGYEGYYWEQLWIENLDLPNSQGIFPGLETSVLLMPSNAKSYPPATYLGPYENILHLWHWDFREDGYLRR